MKDHKTESWLKRYGNSSGAYIISLHQNYENTKHIFKVGKCNSLKKWYNNYTGLWTIHFFVETSYCYTIEQLVIH